MLHTFINYTDVFDALIYIIIRTTIILQMLAVVYETFTNIEREKFRKLLLHKRQACHHAFCLLTTKQNPTKLRFRQFEGLMRYLAPNKSNIFLCFD